MIGAEESAALEIRSLDAMQPLTLDYLVYFGTPVTSVIAPGKNEAEAVAYARAYHISKQRPNWQLGEVHVRPKVWVDERPDLPHPREVMDKDYSYWGADCCECGVPMTYREVCDTADEGYNGHCVNCYEDDDS